MQIACAWHPLLERCSSGRVAAGSHVFSVVEPALACLVSGSWLTEDALAVVETGCDETIAPEGWETVETRDYGAARIWFLKRA